MAALALVVSLAAVATAAKPHVVLVLSDDLGYHDLGYKNGGITQTPHIDALVADGIQLTDYYTYGNFDIISDHIARLSLPSTTLPFPSPPLLLPRRTACSAWWLCGWNADWLVLAIRCHDVLRYKLCSPTRASIQSGRYPWGVGFYDMQDDNFEDANHCIAEDTTLMPALMKRAGYATHAIGKWDVGYIKEHCLPTKRGYETFLGYYTACTSDYWYHGAPGGNLTSSSCGGVDFHDSVGDSIKG